MLDEVGVVNGEGEAFLKEVSQDLELVSACRVEPVCSNVVGLTGGVIGSGVVTLLGSFDVTDIVMHSFTDIHDFHKPS